MGCCGSRKKDRHAVLISVHLLFIAALVIVACTGTPLTAIGVVPSLVQVGDSAGDLAFDGLAGNVV